MERGWPGGGQGACPRRPPDMRGDELSQPRGWNEDGTERPRTREVNEAAHGVDGTRMVRRRPRDTRRERGIASPWMGRGWLRRRPGRMSSTASGLARWSCPDSRQLAKARGEARAPTLVLLAIPSSCSHRGRPVVHAPFTAVPALLGSQPHIVHTSGALGPPRTESIVQGLGLRRWPPSPWSRALVDAQFPRVDAVPVNRARLPTGFPILSRRLRALHGHGRPDDEPMVVARFTRGRTRARRGRSRPSSGEALRRSKPEAYTRNLFR